MRFFVIGLMLLGIVCASQGASLTPLTPVDTTGAFKTSSARGLTVTGDGTAYIAGYGGVVPSGTRAAYWTVSPVGVVNMNMLPADDTGAAATQGNGIGLQADGTVVVSGNLGGASDWTSTAGQIDNGWKRRYRPDSVQAAVGGTANQLAIQSGGMSYFAVGRSASSADTGYSFSIDGATRTDVLDSWNTKGTGATTNGGSVNGVATTGAAVGELRTSSSNIRRAYIHEATGARSLLPGIPERGDGRSQGMGISADGLTAFGYGRWTNDDAFDMPIYWKKDVGAGTWSANKLGRVDSFASSSFVFGSNQNGTILVGTEYPSDPAVETGCFWDLSVLGDNGLPKPNLLLPYLQSIGVDTTGWVRLGRTYSAVTVGELTYMSGDGTWSDDGGTTTYGRGFLVVIPEPATMLLLALGGLTFARRRVR